MTIQLSEIPSQQAPLDRDRDRRHHEHHAEVNHGCNQ
jgi:hypothetical protein